jgi:hypothetical protein
MTPSAETPKLPEARLRKPHVRFTSIRSWSIVAALAILSLVGCSKKGCPWGTEPTEPSVSEGGLRAQWCQKQDSTGSFIKHGWYREWYGGGTLEEEEIFANDYLKESTVWSETGRIASRSFYDNGLLKQIDFFDSDGHKVALLRATAKYREDAKPIRGLTAAHTLPKLENSDLLVFDSTGDRVVEHTVGGEMTLLSGGGVIAHCRANWPPVESECTPTPSDRDNLPQIRSALAAFNHMDQALHEAFDR